MDFSKRKRGSSNSSTSSHLIVSKKIAIEDNLSDSLRYNTDYSVFSTPAPDLAMAALNVGANAPGSILEEGTSPHLPHSSANNSRSVGSMSDASSSTSSPSHREAEEERIVSSAAKLYMKLPEAEKVMRDMLRINTDTFEQSIDRSVNNAIGRQIANLQESVKQDVYNAVKHDMDFANDARYQDVCTQLAELRTQYDNLELNFNREIVSVKKKAIENDQYARRYTIRIRGVTEYQGEDLKNIVCSIIFYKLHVRIQLSDIEIIHRTGHYQHGKIRAILCRFKDRGVKYHVMLQRKNLKGTGIIFDEYNCPEYDEIITSLRSHRFIEKVWAWNGKVMALDKNGDRHMIKYGIDWPAFFDELEAQPRNTRRGPSSSQSQYTAPPPPPPPPPPPSTQISSSVPEIANPRASVSDLRMLPALPATTIPAVSTTNTSATTSSVAITSMSVAPTVTSSIIRPIPAVFPLASSQSDSVSMGLGSATSLNGGATAMIDSQAASTSTPAPPPLRIPLKDIGQISTPPPLTRSARFPGTPQITPRPSKAALAKFSLSPLTRAQRSTPNIASYFNKPPI